MYHRTVPMVEGLGLFELVFDEGLGLGLSKGLGLFELVFDDIPVIYYVFGYEVHCQYLTNIHGPALLERYRVCQNNLQENPPREDIKCLMLLKPIQKSYSCSQFTSPSE